MQNSSTIKSNITPNVTPIPTPKLTAELAIRFHCFSTPMVPLLAFAFFRAVPYAGIVGLLGTIDLTDLSQSVPFVIFFTIAGIKVELMVSIRIVDFFF